MQFHMIAQAEGALEADSPKPDGVQDSLVRVPETAERLKMLFREVLAVVLKHERLVIDDSDRRVRGSRIISVLEQFGQDVSRALHLHELLVPRAGQNRIAVQQVPVPRGIKTDLFKKGWTSLHSRISGSIGVSAPLLLKAVT